MGALHEGHISLIEAAKKKCKNVVASIFVNPTQFNDAADFAQYPVTLARDITMLEQAGCDLLWLPPLSEMYPSGTNNLEQYPLGNMEALLEGKHRPGHFQGVCQVVYRLLQQVKPGHIFMGQKDYQQCMVIGRLLEHTALSVLLETCPTLREPDGLAMSSRNMRLSTSQRHQASAIYATMQAVASRLAHEPPRALEAQATNQLLSAGFSRVDYVSIANPATLEPLPDDVTGQAAVILVAAFLEDVRLIDNLLVPAA